MKRAFALASALALLGVFSLPSEAAAGRLDDLVRQARERKARRGIIPKGGGLYANTARWIEEKIAQWRALRDKAGDRRRIRRKIGRILGGLKRRLRRIRAAKPVRWRWFKNLRKWRNRSAKWYRRISRRLETR